MKIRKECPKNNKYYIRIATGGYNGAVYGEPTQPYANVLDNCVGYANGRFNEIGEYGKCKYQLVCNAENFIEAAKKMGLKISPTPIEGGIMVWQKGATLSGGDGAGHVAVVERVYDDGTIMTSESGWNSWAFKTVRRDNTNGRWGQNEAYKFRGCIINPAVKDPKVVPVPPLTVDGIGGACTVRAMQRFFGTLQDGILSGQNRDCAKYYPALKAVEYGKGGSTCVKKLQSWLGISADGVWGEKTSKALQKKLGVEADGIFGANSVKALQRFLNEHDKVTNDPKPSTPTVEPEKEKSVYDFIDVSDWQSKIDWAKVKAAGIDGAIIRYADGTTLDKRFAENMKGAIKAGLHVGAYIFSRAKTKSEAEKEAERLFNACKPYKYDMPLYIDLEVSSLAKYADTVAAAFLNKMTALGAKGGVYANLNWWNNHLTKTAKNYSASAFWIAQYNDTMDYKPASRMGMWQYTSSGKVNGIEGKVDRDKCYVAYWKKDTDPGGKETVSNHDKVINGIVSFAKDVSKNGYKGRKLHYLKWSKTDVRTHLTPNSIPTAMPEKAVKAGMKGEDVLRVQKFLNWCLTIHLTTDGICGSATAKAIRQYQRKYGLTEDGIFGAACIKKANEIIKEFWGTNCIGAVFFAWRFGGKIKCKCNCGVVDNTTAARIMKEKSDAKANEMLRKRVGIDEVVAIRNDGKKIPDSWIKPGDICVCFKTNETAQHFILSMGNGKIFDSTGGRTPNVSASAALSTYQKRMPIKVIFRYTGK